MHETIGAEDVIEIVGRYGVLGGKEGVKTGVTNG